MRISDWRSDVALPICRDRGTCRRRCRGRDRSGRARRADRQGLRLHLLPRARRLATGRARLGRPVRIARHPGRWQHRGGRRCLPGRIDRRPERQGRGRLRRRHHAVLRQPARWRKGRGRRRLHPQPVGGRAMIQIQYRTQRLSMRFFMLMLVLFVVQVAFGMLLAVQHIDPALLAGTLNFNIARAEHLNLGIIWILSGFIGTILFIGPLLSGRELAAPWMIKFLFYALVAVTIWTVVAQGFASKGIAGWWMGEQWFKEGLEYLEAGRIADVVIMIGFSFLDRKRVGAGTSCAVRVDLGVRRI